MNRLEAGDLLDEELRKAMPQLRAVERRIAVEVALNILHGSDPAVPYHDRKPRAWFPRVQERRRHEEWLRDDMFLLESESGSWSRTNRRNAERRAPEHHGDRADGVRSHDRT